MKSGDFPDGATLVFDLLEYTEKNNMINEGPRKLIGVMVKNTTNYQHTGGWGFEAFEGNGKNRLTKDKGVSCFGCHESQQKSGYVFAKIRN